MSKGQGAQWCQNLVVGQVRVRLEADAFVYDRQCGTPGHCRSKSPTLVQNPAAPDQQAVCVHQRLVSL